MSITDRAIDTEALKQAPHEMIEWTTTEKFSLNRDELEDIQLGGLKNRFSEMSKTIPVLRRFAEDQDVHEIRSIEDGALLLFPHTMYKSYPLSAIENARFGAMTRWAGTLTSIGLSHVDASACRNIDDWIFLMDTRTDIRLRHSSGTTGKLSFIPASTVEAQSAAAGLRHFFAGFGDEPDAHVSGLEHLPMICFTHRRGATASARLIDGFVQYVYGGDESKVFCTNPGGVSADMLSLGGRLEGAQAKGERGRLELSPELLARRDEFLREQAEAPKHLEAFFETAAKDLRGQRVILYGVVPPTVEVAMEGLKRGYQNLFSPDSLFFQAGGAKGRALPDDYRKQVTRFTGVPYPPTGYGMSEGASSLTRLCPNGHYHIQPNIIAYILDPDTGTPHPRRGTQTGRFGMIDLGTQTRWGGFLSGDEVTINYGDQAPCGCGRKGAFIDGEIRRYSELRGGDDKITCAGATGVHDRALDFISKMAE